MKKIILSLGAAAAITVPIVAAVSCGQREGVILEPLKTPEKQNREIESTYNLDGVTYKGIQNYLVNKSGSATHLISYITEKYQDKIHNKYLASRSTSDKYEQKRILQEMKQILIDFLYELGSYHYVESISYEGWTTVISDYTIDSTKIMTVDEISKADFNQLDSLTKKLYAALDDRMIVFSDTIKNLVKSDEYRSWYTDQNMKTHADASNYHLLEFGDSSPFSNTIASVSLNPTDEEINSYFAKVNNYLKNIDITF